MSTKFDHFAVRSMRINLEQIVEGTREQVYAALTTGVALWWVAGHLERQTLAKDLILEARLGGRFYETWQMSRADDDGSLLGTVIQIRKPEVLKMAGFFGLEELNAHGVVAFTLSADNKNRRTIVHLTHDAMGELDDEMHQKMTSTWKDLLNALRDLVEKRHTSGLRKDPALDD